MARGQQTKDPLRGGAMHVPRSRGAAGGVSIALLGVWGAFIPFIGPYFDFAFTPDHAWTWTAARFWLEVVPGVVAVLGGVVMFLTTNRVTAGLGAWLGVAAGAWFVVGRPVSTVLTIDQPGEPSGTSSGLRLLEELAFFTGLGALILFLAASALGRLSVRSVRDVRAAQKREAERAAEEERQREREAQAQARQAAYTAEPRDSTLEIPNARAAQHEQPETSTSTDGRTAT